MRYFMELFYGSVYGSRGVFTGNVGGGPKSRFLRFAAERQQREDGMTTKGDEEEIPTLRIWADRVIGLEMETKTEVGAS